MIWGVGGRESGGGGEDARGCETVGVCVRVCARVWMQGRREIRLCIVVFPVCRCEPHTRTVTEGFGALEMHLSYY